MKKVWLVLLSIFLLASCSFLPKQEPTKSSNLTTGVVKKHITKGKTTQAEILELLGSPNLITMNKNGKEVWNYNRMSFQTIEGSGGGSLILWGGSKALSTTTTKSFDLLITFDENSLVKDYSIISATF
ncbi:MAG: hypothetical protein O2954_14680 [bacterium]|nr:hypothetical protein [bacterium]